MKIAIETILPSQCNSDSSESNSKSLISPSSNASSSSANVGSGESLLKKVSAIKTILPSECNSDSSESNATTNTHYLISPSSNASSSSANVRSGESLLKKDNFHTSQFIALLINNPDILSEEAHMAMAQNLASRKIQSILKQEYSQILSHAELWKRITFLISRVELKIRSKRKLTYWEVVFWDCLNRGKRTAHKAIETILPSECNSDSSESNSKSLISPSSNASSSSANVGSGESLLKKVSAIKTILPSKCNTDSSESNATTNTHYLISPSSNASSSSAYVGSGESLLKKVSAIKTILPSECNSDGSESNATTNTHYLISPSSNASSSSANVGSGESLLKKVSAIKTILPSECNSDSSESNATTNTHYLISPSSNASSSSANVGSGESLLKRDNFHTSQFIALLINNPDILSEEAHMAMAQNLASRKIQSILKQEYSQILSLAELWKRITFLKSRVELKVRSKRKLTYSEVVFWDCLNRGKRTAHKVEESSANSSDRSDAKNKMLEEANFVTILKDYPVLLVINPASPNAEYKASKNEALSKIKHMLLSKTCESINESQICRKVQQMKTTVMVNKYLQKKLAHWEEQFWKYYCVANNLPENTEVGDKITPPSSSGIPIKKNVKIIPPPSSSGILIKYVMITPLCSETPSNKSGQIIGQCEQNKVEFEGLEAFADTKQSNVKSNKKTVSESTNLELNKTNKLNWDQFVAILKDHSLIFYDGEKLELILARHMAIVKIQERIFSEMTVFMSANEIWRRFQTLKSTVNLRKKQKRRLTSWEYEFWRMYSLVIGDDNIGTSTSTDYVALVYKSIHDTFGGDQDADKNNAEYALCDDVITREENDKIKAKNELVCMSDDDDICEVEPIEYVAVGSDETTITIKSEGCDLTEDIDNESTKSTKLKIPKDRLPEIEETKDLSLSELKRFVLLENLKYLRSAQELVDLKVKHELSKNYAGAGDHEL